jgi:hypothetical protein
LGKSESENRIFDGRFAEAKDVLVMLHCSGAAAKSAVRDVPE